MGPIEEMLAGTDSSPRLSPKAKDPNATFAEFALHTFETYRAGYLSLWSAMTVSKRAEAQKQVDLVVKHADVYKGIEAVTNVPWLVIGLLHLREAGPQDVGRWLCCLHNGEKIIGTGRKTRLVPKGCGPFSTFKAAAIDALKREGLTTVNWSKDGIARVAYSSEIFNGFGYRQHGIPSPYLWGGSSVQKRGKYVADGVYDANTMDPQIGTMTLLRVAMDTTGFSFGPIPVSPVAPTPAPVAPAPAPVSPPPVPSKPIIEQIDPQKQIGGLLNILYRFIQNILKRKS